MQTIHKLKYLLISNLHNDVWKSFLFVKINFWHCRELPVTGQSHDTVQVVKVMKNQRA